MAMYTAYYDDSGSPDQTLAFVVAGFLAKTQQWIHFEKNWKAILKDFGMDYFHMREYAHSVGQFRMWKNHKTDPKEKDDRELFLRRLLAEILVRANTGLGCAVIMEDYNAVNQEYMLEEFFKPYALCGRTCVAKACLWANRWNIPESEVLHVFEDGTEDKGALIEMIKKDKGFTPIFMNKRECAPLQAADLMAYEHLLANRDVFRKRIESFDELRYPLKVIDKLRHEESDWGTYLRKDLEALCVKSGLPRRQPQK